MSYQLTTESTLDLENILVQGIQDYGIDAAIAYYERLFQVLDLLAQFPEISRERIELSPPVRIHPVGSHLIIYLISNERHDITIIRVCHAHEDWLSYYS
jgi:toxin ParE1/3/4